MAVRRRNGFPNSTPPHVCLTPDQVAAGGQSLSVDTGPSIFTAVQEQLGLKLESTKGPVEVVVIDHVELPTED